MGPTLRAAVWDFLPLWNNSALQTQYSLKLKSSVGHKLVKIWTLWSQPKVLLPGVSRYTWSTVNKSQPCQSSWAFWDWTIQPALSPCASLLSSFILLSFRFHSNLVLISLLRCTKMHLQKQSTFTACSGTSWHQEGLSLQQTNTATFHHLLPRWKLFHHEPIETVCKATRTLLFPLQNTTCS